MEAVDVKLDMESSAQPLYPSTLTTIGPPTLMDALGFFKDVVELGLAIKDSVDKVGQNNKRSRQLINEVIDILDDLKSLYDDDQPRFSAAIPLREASARLKQNLESVHSLCQNLVPERKQRKLLVKAKATYVAWKNRDDIEEELRRLKGHVVDCLAKFTAFSAGRTENAVARTEHALVRTEHALVLHSAETRFKLNHLDLLVCKILIDSPWGERVVNSIEINVSDHQSIERQYLKLQTHNLVTRLEALLATKSYFQIEPPNSNHTAPVLTTIQSTKPSFAVVHEICSLRCLIEDGHDALSIQDTAWKLNNIGHSLATFDLQIEAMAAYHGASQMYHSVSQQHPDFLPFLVTSDIHFAHKCIDQPSLAIPIIKRATAALDFYEAQSGVDASVFRAWTLCMEGVILLNGKDFESASQTFATSLSLYSDIIQNSMSTFPHSSPMAVRQLIATFEHASKAACCGYADCMVELGRPLQAVSVLMQGLSHYQHLPSWATDHFVVPQDISQSLTRTVIKVYVDSQLSLEFLHELVAQLLPLAILRPRLLSYPFWQITAIYASLSAAHSTVPHHDVIPIPISPTFTFMDTYKVLPMTISSRLAELLSLSNMDVLFDDYFAGPVTSHTIHFDAPLVGRIITMKDIQKRAKMLEEPEITDFLLHLWLILGSHTPEAYRLPIYTVADMLFKRITSEEHHRRDGAELYAGILVRLGMFKSALDTIDEYISTPRLYIMSMQIVSLVKLGHTSDVIQFVQPFMLEFWSWILCLSVSPSPSWASICDTFSFPEIMMALKISWMLSTGYFKDLSDMKLDPHLSSLKHVVDDLHEFASMRRGLQRECTPLIPRELWEMFRSKCPETDPATLIFGSQMALTLGPATPLLTSNDSLTAHPETCEADIDMTPPPDPTNSTTASPAAHLEVIHATKSGDSAAPTIRWYKLGPTTRFGLNIAAVLIIVTFYLSAGHGMSLTLNFH